MEYEGWTEPFKVAMPPSNVQPLSHTRNPKLSKLQTPMCHQGLSIYLRHWLSQLYKIPLSQMKKMNFSQFDLEHFNMSTSFIDWNIDVESSYMSNVTQFYILKIFLAHAHYNLLNKSWIAVYRNNSLNSILAKNVANYHNLVNVIEAEIENLKLSNTNPTKQLQNIMNIVSIESKLHVEQIKNYMYYVFNLTSSLVNNRIKEQDVTDFIFENLFNFSHINWHDSLVNVLELPYLEAKVKNNNRLYWLKDLSSYKLISNNLTNWIHNSKIFQAMLPSNELSMMISNHNNKSSSIDAIGFMDNAIIGMNQFYNNSMKVIRYQSKHLIKWIKKYSKFEW